MSSLEQPFIEAINAGEIEGVLIEGRSKSGKSYSKAIGNRTLPDGTSKPLQRSDLLFLASATKFLTTLAALQCCESGKLSLDADVSESLGEVPKLGILTGWDESSSEGSFEPLKKAVTLRHLLTHSSGLVYDFTIPTFMAWRKANPTKDGALGVEGRFTAPLAFQPGEGWMYGTGISWAGRLIEQATGLRLDDYFRQHIFRPLGVADTGISFFPVAEGQGDRMPDLNPKDPKGLGLSAAMGNSLHDETTGYCYGGEGGYASAEAYIAVLYSLLADDGKILSHASVEELMKPQLESGAKDSLAERLEGPWGPFFNMGTTGKHPDYSLGGLFLTEGGDGSGLGKGTISWGGGCNSAWFIDPENDICGFLSPQLGIPPDVEKGLELKTIFRKYLKEQLGTEH